MKASFKVRQDLAYWAGPMGKLEPGVDHEIDTDAESMKSIIAAGAAGVLVNLSLDEEAEKLDAVESDHASALKLVQAMGELGPDGRFTGPWMIGHLAQMEIEEESDASIEIG